MAVVRSGYASKFYVATDRYRLIEILGIYITRLHVNLLTGELSGRVAYLRALLHV